MSKENKPLNSYLDNDFRIHSKDKIQYISPLVKCFQTKNSLLGGNAVVGSDNCNYISTMYCSNS